MNDSYTDTPAQDPAAIEQDIRRTQEDMSRTVDRIGDQLTFRNLFNALLDKADQNDVDTRYLIDGARRNPIALGLIAAGAIWLVSDKDSKFPAIKKSSSGSSDGPQGWDETDIHHKDYVAHMSAVEIRDGEDDLAYQRRRDIARANFLMCERDPGEDDHSFRQRLNAMTDTFREKRRAWSDSVGQTTSRAGSAARDTARASVGRAQDAYFGNPLVGGILAAAIGAAVGSAFPTTRQEQEKLGGIGEKARQAASDRTGEVASKLREKKDELVLSADQKLQDPRAAGQEDKQPQPAGDEPDFGGDQHSSERSPFMIGDRQA